MCLSEERHIWKTLQWEHMSVMLSSDSSVLTLGIEGHFNINYRDIQICGGGGVVHNAIDTSVIFILSPKSLYCL